MGERVEGAQRAKASILLHSNTIPKKSSESTLTATAPPPHPNRFTSTQIQPPLLEALDTTPTLTTCTRLTRREARSCRWKEGGRNCMKTISLLKEIKEGRERANGKENRTTETFQMSLSKQKCEKVCAQDSLVAQWLRICLPMQGT